VNPFSKENALRTGVSREECQQQACNVNSRDCRARTVEHCHLTLECCGHVREIVAGLRVTLPSIRRTLFAHHLTARDYDLPDGVKII